MATLAVMAGGLLMAAGMAWVGVQGLRGVPDSTGQKTSKGTAVACPVLATRVGGAAATPGRGAEDGAARRQGLRGMSCS